LDRTKRLERELSKEETQLQQMTTDIKKLELELETQNTRSVTLQGKISFISEKSKALGDQKDQLQRILKEKEEQYKEELELSRMLEAQLEESKKALEAQKGEMKALTNKISGLREQRNKIKTLNEDLNRQYNENKSRNTTLRGEASGLEGEVANLSLAQERLKTSVAATTPPVSHAPSTAPSDFFSTAGLGAIDSSETRDSFGPPGVSAPNPFSFQTFSQSFDFSSTSVAPLGSSLQAVEVTGDEGKNLFGNDDSFA